MCVRKRRLGRGLARPFCRELGPRLHGMFPAPCYAGDILEAISWVAATSHKEALDWPKPVMDDLIQDRSSKTMIPFEQSADLKRKKNLQHHVASAVVCKLSLRRSARSRDSAEGPSRGPDCPDTPRRSIGEGWQRHEGSWVDGGNTLPLLLFEVQVYFGLGTMDLQFNWVEMSSQVQVHHRSGLLIPSQSTSLPPTQAFYLLVRCPAIRYAPPSFLASPRTHPANQSQFFHPLLINAHLWFP